MHKLHHKNSCSPNTILQHKNQNIFIKICGIQNENLAIETAKAGAHFIGLIFYSGSRRCVSIEKAKKISEMVKEYHAIPVAVFFNHSAQEMEDICEQTQIKTVQLYGYFSKAQHYLLPQIYQRIYVQEVSLQGKVQMDREQGLNFCDPKRDFLLFDVEEPGQGQTFDWNFFNQTSPYRIGLAGGLNAENVGTAIEKINPVLFDVSSGVENKNGEKDITLIETFINAIYVYRKAGTHDSI